MARTPSLWAAAIAAAGTALLVTACSPPDPIPVQADVTWEAGVPPAGQRADDPRAEAVYEYSRWRSASVNALNLSDPRLAEHTSPTVLYDLQRTVRLEDMAFFEGPHRIAIVEIRDRDGSQTLTGEEGSRSFSDAAVVTCEQASPWWRTIDNAPGNATRVEGYEDIVRVEPTTYREATYRLVEEDGTWKVDGISGSDRECDPGDDVAVGTYTVQPDLNLLLDATDDMVVYSDGSRASDR